VDRGGIEGKRSEECRGIDSEVQGDVMANPEHLAKLKEALDTGDIEIWNKWRRQNFPLSDNMPVKEKDWSIWRNKYPHPDFQFADLQKANLIGADMQGACFRDAYMNEAVLTSGHFDGADFFGAELNRANMNSGIFNGAKFQSAKMKEVNLSNARMVNVDLINAELESAFMNDVVLDEAALNKANFREARMSGATMKYAWLAEANMENALMIAVDLEGSDLQNANLSYANLSHSNLRKCKLYGANFTKSLVFGVKYDRKIRCIDADVNTCRGSEQFKRFVKDQAYLEELRASRVGKLVYWAWLVLCDCGRSVSLWSFWCFVMVCFYAYIFYLLSASSFHVLNIDTLGWSYWSCLYYSVVTFTTLGFGDITPKFFGSACWVMVEVITGYIMLGGLISIFSNKLARRS
jgi:uncharacterized protein YjbI with pentapeptide repeats